VSSGRPEANHVSLAISSWHKGYTLCLCNAVFPSQVAVSFHCQRAAVLVSEPARNSGNIYARFDAASREQVPEIVMRDAVRPYFFACSIKRFLTFTNAKDFCAQRLFERRRRIRSNSSRVGIMGTGALPSSWYGFRSPRTTISPLSNQVRHSTAAASPSRQPVNANPRKKSAQSYEHHAPAWYTASTICKN
jgi:hypothetical protein